MNSKRIILLFIVIALSSERAHSQYIPTVLEGKEWTISLSFGLGVYWYPTYTLRCDTVIEKTTYVTLYNQYGEILGFAREDTSAQVVYFLDVNAEKEDTILSYKGEVGDTIHLSGEDLIIQDIYYENLFGAVRKVIFIDGLLSLIEGAGTSRYGIIRNYWPPPPYPSLYDLREQGTSCDSITSTEPLTRGISFTAFPNPFTDFIHIATSENIPQYYEVYNSFGIRLLSGYCVHEATVDMTPLIPGMYVIVINSQIIKMIKL